MTAEGTQRRTRAATANGWLLMLLTAWPWLNPFMPGPTPAVVPWLTGAACGVMAWCLAALKGVAFPVRACLVCLIPPALGAMHASFTPELAALMAALLLIVLSAAAARLRPTAWTLGLLLAASLSAIMGLAQAFGVAEPLWPWVSHARIGEAWANLRQPNQFGTLCWLGVCVLLWGRPRLRSPLSVALAVLLGLAAAASASRTAVLQGLLLGLLLLVWPGNGHRRRLVTWTVAMTTLVLGALVLPRWVEVFAGQPPARALLSRLSEGSASCSSRRVLWDNVLTLIGQRPWTGWGWGELDFAHFWTLYPGQRFCDLLDNAHNLPLHLAVETGVPVAVLAVGACAAWVLRRRPWTAQTGQHRLAWAILLLIGTHSMLEYPLWYAPFEVAVGAALGWLWRRPGTARAAVPASRTPGLVVGAALSLMLVWAGWDYARVSQAYRAPDQRWQSMRNDPAGQMSGLWLFGQQARFAQLWTAQPSPATAESLYVLAMRTLHYSPEPRVIEQGIASAQLAGRDAEAQALEQRYRVAFPERWAAWRAGGQR